MDKKSEPKAFSNNLDAIYNLINELSCSKPDTHNLKSLCLEAGIIFDSDLVQLMSKVLILASSVSPMQNKNNQQSKKISKLLSNEA